MLSIQHQPVEARAGTQFCASCIGERYPQSDLGLTVFDRLLETIDRYFHRSTFSNEAAGNRSQRPVVNVKGVAGARRHDPGERTCKHDLPGFQSLIMQCELI